ncbi:response regulator transcription factor [Paracoccus caeni]|uniref:Response regulator transcription factor n=1 Tax=Paracoccus caeni TaxID=657651 RepID=A0A934SM98_9RHOB|nr:response regulator transcription factor [Paracoccus caeni]MBK4217669.1 response regulator transcription factor [Paracoccus caeni]
MERPTRTMQLASALIVDDHPLFCDALSMTLRGAFGMSQVEAVGSLEAALDWLKRHPLPDVLVLDLNLPDVNGLDGVVRIRQAAPDTPVVVVSSMGEGRIVNAALQAGVDAFVPKHADRNEFREAFEVIARGEIHASRLALKTSDLPSSEDSLTRLALLTPQQAKILQLVSSGLMNKQIAWELSIAETTVKAHITAIMRKLGVQTRTQAALFAQDLSFSSFKPDE